MRMYSEAKLLQLANETRAGVARRDSDHSDRASGVFSCSAPRPAKFSRKTAVAWAFAGLVVSGLIGFTAYWMIRHPKTDGAPMHLNQSEATITSKRRALIGSEAGRVWDRTEDMNVTEDGRLWAKPGATCKGTVRGYEGNDRYGPTASFTTEQSNQEWTFDIEVLEGLPLTVYIGVDRFRTDDRLGCPSNVIYFKVGEPVSHNLVTYFDKRAGYVESLANGGTVKIIVKFDEKKIYFLTKDEDAQMFHYVAYVRDDELDATFNTEVELRPWIGIGYQDEGGGGIVRATRVR